MCVVTVYCVQSSTKTGRQEKLLLIVSVAGKDVLQSRSANEYQLLLGRQRQVWFIPLADVRGVGI